MPPKPLLNPNLPDLIVIAVVFKARSGGEGSDIKSSNGNQWHLDRQYESWKLKRCRLQYFLLMKKTPEQQTKETPYIKVIYIPYQVRSGIGITLQLGR